MNQYFYQRVALRLCAIALVALLAACGRLDLATGPLLYDASFSAETITPNADGDTDAVSIAYSLRRAAEVSIYFENAAGERFYFRNSQRRAPDDYRVDWGGVIDEPRVLDSDMGRQEVLSQVLADGDYTWTIEATADSGDTASESGPITLREGDSELPLVQNFAVVPEVFTPNQDGIGDRVSVSYTLTKDVDIKQVYLFEVDEPTVRFVIPEDEGVEEPEDRGYHSHNYDGGVDLNAEPPPGGSYIVRVDVRDLAGNAVRVEEKLDVESSGQPRADIAGGELHWLDEWVAQEGDSIEMNRNVSVMLGQQICVRAVVVNEGTVPIRTSGPWPGETFQFSENYNTLAVREENASWEEQDGVWRFGVNYQSSVNDLPFRWAVGRQKDLTMRRDEEGREQWYLDPNERGITGGCIIVDEEPLREGTIWWGALIHQSVEVVNNNVDRITIRVGVP